MIENERIGWFEYKPGYRVGIPARINLPKVANVLGVAPTVETVSTVLADRGMKEILTAAAEAGRATAEGASRLPVETNSRMSIEGEAFEERSGW